jgi:hypothetical protein
MCELFVADVVDGQASVLALWCGLIIALNAMAEIDCARGCCSGASCLLS